jgi:hypothetical protein
MTSFFYAVSIAYRTIEVFQHFGSAWIPLGKKVFWLRAQPLVRHLLHLFVGPERLASRRLFERSKDMKVTGGKVWRVQRMWKTLKGQILGCYNS